MSCTSSFWVELCWFCSSYRFLQFLSRSLTILRLKSSLLLLLQMKSLMSLITLCMHVFYCNRYLVLTFILCHKLFTSYSHVISFMFCWPVFLDFRSKSSAAFSSSSVKLSSHIKSTSWLCLSRLQLQQRDWLLLIYMLYVAAAWAVSHLLLTFIQNKLKTLKDEWEKERRQFENDMKVTEYEKETQAL